MKKVYERPLMSVELFVANQAVSTCTVEGGIDWTFDCMIGPTTDSATCVNVSVASGCTTQVGYAAGVQTARDYCLSNNGHSDNSIGQWSDGSGGSENGSYLQVFYSGAEGILYADSTGTGNSGGGGHGNTGNTSTASNITTANWSVVAGEYVWHSSTQGGNHHMVAPVMDSRSINASW